MKFLITVIYIVMTAILLVLTAITLRPQRAWGLVAVFVLGVTVCWVVLLHELR